MEIKVLDCTLRDGGYYNNWNFSEEFVQKYILSISNYASIAELGLRLLNSTGYKGPLAFTKDKWLSKFELPKNIIYAVMINAADFKNSKNINEDLDNLFPISSNESCISLVRIAARASDFIFLGKIINFLKFKGYDVAINLMQISEYGDEELKNICFKINKLSPSIFYVADSLGSLNQKDIKNIFRVISKYTDIPLGMHAHDNMSLARENTLSAISSGASYIDSTLLGMGRGAGNAKTEEIFLQLSYSQNDEYSLVTLFEFLHKFMRPLKSKYCWGPDYLYMLSAMHKIHPSFVQHLINDKRYSIGDILNIFNFLKNIDSKNISSSQIDQIEEFSYSSFTHNILSDYESFKLPKFDNILLVASGVSSIQYSNELKNFAEEYNCLLVTLNALSSFTRKNLHLRAACNPVRFIADKELYLKTEEILLLPDQLINLLTSSSNKNSQKIIKYNLKIDASLIEFSNQSCTISSPLALFYALCFALSIKKEKIYIAGIDGYPKGDIRNEIIDKLFYKVNEKTDTQIVAITPTIHKSITHNSLFNF